MTISFWMYIFLSLTKPSFVVFNLLMSIFMYSTDPTPRKDIDLNISSFSLAQRHAILK
jgi:hypothetical protein